MRLQKSPGLAAVLCLIICMCAFYTTTAFDIPLEVLGHVNIEQLPTITDQSPSSLIAFPFDESFPMTCEAKGNPEPEFRWTKNGQEFDPDLDPRLMKEENSGTFVIPNNGNLTEYQGNYRCYASNRLGTSISKEIEFIVPHVPKFPKETLDPLEVEEGQPFVLQCNPPQGIPPLQIYWMTINLQHIEQDERVSMGLNGNLYFSHAVEKDSRRDYCCFAAFPRIRTIVQKNAMSVIVKTTNVIMKRRPSLLTPYDHESETQLVKGEDLKLECIAEGFPTPQVEWVRMGHQLLPSKAIQENHKKQLIVPRVELEDSGRASGVGGGAGEITWRVNGEPLQGSPAANRKVFDDTIMLHNAKESDSAVYQCEASNKHGTLLSNANIMIMNLAPMILTKEGEEYTAVEGKGVMMHCNVFSSPPPTITWSRDDSPESVQGQRFSVHDNGSLEIYGTEKDDMGQYQCFAKNTEGSSALNAMLYVRDPTRIVAAQEDLQVLVVRQVLHHDFELLWEKDDIPITLNYTENSRYFVENGVLQITNVSHRDQGLFTCVARTPVDRDAASALLMVLDVPDAPEYLVLSDHKSRSVKLKWIPGDDHNSSTTEFIIEYEESQWEPGSWKELLRIPGNHNSAVAKLHGHVDYRFRVSGVNDVGRGRPSEPTERYKTPATAPDKNPENVKIEGHLPHEMNINWEPLLPIQHNGPGLEYEVFYKRQGVEEDWQKHTVKRHSFVVKNTPTFVPYEIKIQARNNQGRAPEPKIVSGYSGEDFPSAAPEDVSVEVMNSSVVKVSWTLVHKDTLHGHLGGYRVNWWRMRSLADSKKKHGEKQTLAFPGDRNHGVLPGLTPFSEYSLIVMTFNGRGNGPGSHPLNFKTPEGVPEKNPVFRVTDVQKHTVSLAWAAPSEPNGILTGYLLEYQLNNETEEVGPLQTLNISDPDTNKWILHDLEPLSKYKLYLRSCTAMGCGPISSEECTTTLETSKSASPSPPSTRRSPVTKPTRSTIGLASVHGGISTQGWFIGLMCAIALLTLIVLIACFVNRNKGGKYSVKEKEDLHPDVESQGMNDDTFCEYSDNDEKPLKGSQRSLSREIKAGDSGDSLVDYGDEDVQFNEDGSFIGEYAGRKEKRVSAEIKAPAQTPA
ncbi:Neural cell adhesion molecule L1-like protein [Dissostichus eleginoides]|uniref:Neural cell adhesion molecule L1-like protein n=1 Tax=Dissostichus eleginoides TaxID=100907 RepID=A0AAD9CII7_DISEL|nr:Neural cell adhesion molecule L1-like protein [Dissostichus eleginoides]